MIPVFENIQSDQKTLITAKKEVIPYINIGLHFHPEFEIVYIARGDGQRIVGNSVENFEDGDLVLLGSYLPHTWQNSSEYCKDASKNVEINVLHFSYSLFNSAFSFVREMEKIMILLEKSTYGIRITGNTHEKIVPILIETIETQGIQRIIGLFEILKHIENHPENCTLLSRIDYKTNKQYSQSNRMNKVFSFISENYNENISLESVAIIANMNPSSFSRYFKSYTNITFTAYLNKVRINYAEMILKAGKNTISQTAYACGYNNPSYFIKQFRHFKGCTPHEYMSQNQLVSCKGMTV